MPYPIAVGALAADNGIEADLTTAAYLLALATSFVSAGIRLIPLGQSAGIRVIAALEPLVLAIAAQIPLAEIGSGYFQETHPQTLFKECSYYCELIAGANQMPHALEVAIREAVGKRGVSVVVIPGDVALQAASDAPPVKVAGLLPPAPVVTPANKDLDRLAALLNDDSRVTILCGSG